MRLKQLLITTFVVIFMSSVIWLIVEAAKPEVLPVDSLIPEIEYTDLFGQHVLTRDYTLNTMVVLFHRKCDHCNYQLKLINDNIEEFINTQIFLLTTEKIFFKSEYIMQWNDLGNANNVHWGTVERDVLKKRFGSTVMPSIFFFDKGGALYNKIRGEVKLLKILSILRNHCKKSERR